MSPVETLDAGEQLDADEEATRPLPGLVLAWNAGAPEYRAIASQGRPLSFGRAGGDADITLNDGLISRQHAEFRVADGRATIRDLGSRNGLFVDGTRCAEARLDDGSVIRIGHSLLVFVADIRGLGGEVRREDGALVDPCLRRSWDRIARFAELSRHLLIRGESGTGKELAARTFHRVTGGAERPFIAVNCAAIPEGVAERLLFGTRKGAYSGAAADAPGYVQAAHGGTLFLDEFGELDLGVQAKLLRFLESGEALPLGAVRPLRLDVRVCLATNRDLREEVADGRFRGDLYYRVAEPSVILPPLRQRKQSIPWLVQDALDALTGLSAHALLIERCLLRPWPGNVRELRMAIAAAGQEAQLADRAQVLRADLPDDAGEAVDRRAAAEASAPTNDAPAPPDRSTSSPSLRDAEEAVVLDMLKSTGGNVSKAARRLGVHRNQLRRWLEKKGLDAGSLR
ncbi:MAG: sigma 54-interacting transcriptional regulator [Myxococcales bacterium]|nr:sigma 54-interacting transcriptional regulator [Myxococcales bacterium]